MPKVWRAFKSIGLPIIAGLFIAFLIKMFLFSFVSVNGSSMYPNLQNNERVGLVKVGAIKRNHVIVFEANGVDREKTFTKKTYYVKRVIAVPGDTVKYTATGKLYINGKFQSQSYITQQQRVDGTLQLVGMMGQGFTLKTLSKAEHWPQVVTKVPKNYYFVMGDNRANSNDGRSYGLVPRSKIEGTVKAFPWNPNHQLINK